MGVVGCRGSVKERLLSRIQKNENGCWIWTAANNQKYGCLYAWGRQRGAHRVSYQVFHGPIPKGAHVCHRCDEPLCVNPAHLWLGTRRENMADAKHKGRTVAGDRAPHAKLTWTDVRALRRAFPQSEVEIMAWAQRLGVARRTVYRILRGETWVEPDSAITRYRRGRRNLKKGPRPARPRPSSVKSANVPRGHI